MLHVYNSAFSIFSKAAIYKNIIDVNDDSDNPNTWNTKKIIIWLDNLKLKTIFFHLKFQIGLSSLVPPVRAN